MSLVRAKIRSHVRDMLLGRTSAGTRIYTNRQAPLFADAELPVIVITTDREEAERIREAPQPVWRRRLELGVEVLVRAKGHPAIGPTGTPAVEVDELLDQVMAEVEGVLFIPPTLEPDHVRWWGLPEIQELEHTGCEIEVREDQARLVAAGRISFVVGYDVVLESPTDVLADAETLHVDWHLAEIGAPKGDSLLDAADDIDLPQS